MTFTGDLVALTVSTGPDHSHFDVYINKTLWQTIDAYESSGGERTLWIALDDGDHVLELRNRRYRNRDSSGNKIGFKQLDIFQIAVDEQVIDYTYDALSRLLEADYNSGETVYQYGFDVAGNLVNLEGTTRTYNAANQLTNDGTNTLTYDANGNLTHDGVNAYTWDRANRLLSHDGLDYAYDGNGNRISKDDGVDVTQYLLDLQPGLALVLREDDGTNTNHYVHGLHGVHTVNDGAGWTYPLPDGLNSVRGYVGANNAVESSISYSPVGVPDTSIIGPAFTGEWRDETEVQYHRARYLSPGLGVWASLDPWEGLTDIPMSINRYTWVEGNPINRIDVSGYYPPSPCWELALGFPGVYDDTICAGVGLIGGLLDGSINPQSIGRSISNFFGGSEVVTAMPFASTRGVLLTDTVQLLGVQGAAVAQQSSTSCEVLFTPIGQMLAHCPNQPLSGELGIGRDIPSFAPPISGLDIIVGQTDPVIRALVNTCNQINGGLCGGTGDSILSPTSTRSVSASAATQTDAVPVPFLQDRPIPEDYNLRFDGALGIDQYLAQFAASFTDYPTVFFYWWPAWMITDTRLFTANNSDLIASIVIASLRLWAASPSRGVIKFNMEGIREISDKGDYHRTTLAELRNLFAAPDLLAITQFYRFEMGIPIPLLGTELAEEMALTVPLFARL